MERAEQRVDWLLDLEDGPFTLNTHYHLDYKAKFLAHYKGVREEDRNAAFMNAIREHMRAPPQTSTQGLFVGGRHASSTTSPSAVSRALAALAEAGLAGNTVDDLAKLIPSDGMDPALIIMAEVRAYFQGKYRSFSCPKSFSRVADPRIFPNSCLQTLR